MLKVSVISPEKVLYEGNAESVIVPAFDGEVGIMTDHAPFMTLVGDGTLKVRESGSEKRFSVSGGFLQVADNHVRVVTEKATGSE